MTRPRSLGQPERGVARRIEIVAGLDQLRAERPHGRVLFDRIALRHDDGGGDAGLGGGQRDALAMIAARGADHAPSHGCGSFFSRSM